MKRVAILGLGDIAKVHIPVLRAVPGVALCAVCDINPRKKELAADVPFYEDAQRVLDEVKPDAVHLCLPHYLHYPMAAAAAKAGVHVFCEKPLALCAEEALLFAALEREYRAVRFGLCLQNRYNKSTIALQKIIQGGAEGAVTGIKGLVAWYRPKEYYTASPWRGMMEQAGGGVMINQSIHTLDIMRLFGGRLLSLRGSICNLMDLGTEVEDTATAKMQFANGASGFFMATNANSKNDNVEIAVTMEKAEYVIADNALYKICEDGCRERICEDERLPGTRFYYGAGHAAAIGAFYEAMQNGTEDYIHAEQGVISMQMIDAIRKSAGNEILFE